MERWDDLDQKLKHYVNPASFPVAVARYFEHEKVPQNAKYPRKDLGVRLAPCQAQAMARLYGWTLTLTQEDQACGIAAHTLGWRRAEESGAVEFMTTMQYTYGEGAARDAFRNLPLLEENPDLIMVYSPLVKNKITPEVVCIYVNPAQLMRLIHGATFRTGKALNTHLSGRAASCSEGVVAALRDQSPKVVVPGNGDRVWGGCQDQEMMMAIPATSLAEIVEGLERTHSMGIRYPVPAYLKYSPEVAMSMPLSDVFAPGVGSRLKK